MFWLTQLFNEFAESESLGFRGRLPRFAFLAMAFWRLALTLAAFLLGSLLLSLLASNSAAGLAFLIAAGIGYLSLVPLIIRRFHDISLPAWSALCAMFVPVIPLIGFGISLWTASEGGLFWPLAIFAFGQIVSPFWFLGLLILVLLPSTPQHNKYGPNLNL